MSMDDRHPDHLGPFLNRRSILRAGAMFGAAAGVGAVGAVLPRPAAASHSAPRTPDRRARNVIFLVSDGMSTGTLTLADMMIRRQRSGKSSSWMGLWGQPGVRRFSARTHSLDSLVTDSAAGGSAWGCGAHINNGFVNVMPDGRQLLPILVHARQKGKATGVVTTARVTHATPASFYANSPRRDFEGMIGSQLLARGIDVALGGGRNFFPKAELQKHPEVQVVNSAAELRKASPDGRLLGVFASGHVPFVVDRDDTRPGLVEMSRVALSRLEKHAGGFLLQIEGGRVDHAAHNNDAGSLVREQIEFDDTVAAVLEWAKGRDDTLIVLTSDHGNANPGLTLYGQQGNDAFARLEKAANSFDWIDAQNSGLKQPKDRVAKMAASVRTAFDYELTAGDQDLLVNAMQDHRVMPFVESNHWPAILGGILANHFGVSFVSGNHTSDYVEVTALGPGSELIAGGNAGAVIDNIDLHGVMVAALNLGEGELLPDMKEPMQLAKPIKPD